MEPEGKLKREKPQRKPGDAGREEMIKATLQVTDADFIDIQNDLGGPGVETMLGRIKELLESSKYSARMLRQLGRGRCKQLSAAYKQRFVEAPASTVELGPQRRALRSQENRAKEGKGRKPKAEAKSETNAPSSSVPNDTTSSPPAEPASSATRADSPPAPTSAKESAAVFQHPTHGPITDKTWPGLDVNIKREIVKGFSQAYKSGMNQAQPIHAFLNQAKVVDDSFQLYLKWPTIHAKIVAYLTHAKTGTSSLFQWFESGEIMLFEGPIKNECEAFFHEFFGRPKSFRFERTKSKWREAGNARHDTKRVPDAKSDFIKLFKEAGNVKCEFCK